MVSVAEVPLHGKLFAGSLCVVVQHPLHMISFEELFGVAPANINPAPACIVHIQPRRSPSGWPFTPLKYSTMHVVLLVPSVMSLIRVERLAPKTVRFLGSPFVMSSSSPLKYCVAT